MSFPSLVSIAGAMKGIEGPNRSEIINRQLCHFFRADVSLGMGVAKGLDVNLEALPKEVLPHR